MRSSRIWAFRLLFLFPVLTACHSGSLAYDWGSYEGSVQRFYNPEQTFAPETEIQRIDAELQATRPERVPPGKAAYLGFLYAMTGNNAAAREAILLEKELFPEFATFADHLLANLK